MSELSNIVTREKFINAFKICKNYCVNSKNNILDVNFRLIKSYLLELEEKDVIDFYNTYIKTELVYSYPEFYSCESITIPKNGTGIREYKFFSTFSMILYNAIGLCFVECSNEMINSLNFNDSNIYPFYPTKFYPSDKPTKENLKWNVKNDYKLEYNKYQKKFKEIVTSEAAILQLDITQYFESIIHDKLIDLLTQFSTKPILTKNNIDSDSKTNIQFYFESLMLKRLSIPQGKKNFVSDFFGYFYLVPFDLCVEELCKGFKLKFRGMIRYVDDITIVFDNPNKLNTKEVYRELLVLESKITNWFLKSLGLSINPNKTKRLHLRNKTEEEEFIEKNKKSISGIELITDESSDEENSIQKKFEEFNDLLGKFNFNDQPIFKIEIEKKEKENLKLIYNEKDFQNFLKKPDIVKKISQSLKKVDIELTVDFINMFVVLFLLKDKNQKYLYVEPITKFLKNTFKPIDKRHIHIIHILLAQENLDKDEIFNIIVENSEELIKDNYGKYLITFSGKMGRDVENHLDNEKLFFNRLNNEFSNVDFNEYFVAKSDNVYSFIIGKLIIDKSFTKTPAITNQIKYYLLYRRTQKWDLAFNHFLNFFHEICKIVLKKDDPNVKEICKHDHFTLKEKLIINKFFSRRNFNPISHGSQKKIPSIKVDKREFLQFEKDILEILTRLL